MANWGLTMGWHWGDVVHTFGLWMLVKKDTVPAKGALAAKAAPLQESLKGPRDSCKGGSHENDNGMSYALCPHDLGNDAGVQTFTQTLRPTALKILFKGVGVRGVA